MKYLCAVMWTPYFATVLDAWANRNHPNMLFLFFEDMKKVSTYNCLILFQVGSNVVF